MENKKNTQQQNIVTIDNGSKVVHQGNGPLLNFENNNEKKKKKSLLKGLISFFKRLLTMN